MTTPSPAPQPLSWRMWAERFTRLLARVETRLAEANPLTSARVLDILKDEAGLA